MFSAEAMGSELGSAPASLCYSEQTLAREPSMVTNSAMGLVFLAIRH